MNAILRTSNNPKVFSQLNCLLSFDIINHFFVIIDAKKDSTTAEALKLHPSASLITTISLQNYGWSTALNKAIEKIKEMNFEKYDLLIISNEVEVKKEELISLKNCLSSSNACCGYSLFSNRTEFSYTLPRNTFIIWKNKVIFNGESFLENLDNIGMEDYEMILRLYKDKGLLPYIGAKNVTLCSHPCEEKLIRESSAINTIKTYYSSEIINAVDKHIKTQNNI